MEVKTGVRIATAFPVGHHWSNVSRATARHARNQDQCPDENSLARTDHIWAGEEGVGVEPQSGRETRGDKQRQTEPRDEDEQFHAEVIARGGFRSRSVQRTIPDSVPRDSGRKPRGPGLSDTKAKSRRELSGRTRKVANMSCYSIGHHHAPTNGGCRGRTRGRTERYEAAQREDEGLPCYRASFLRTIAS
jgi:hypothetical protein